MNTKTRKQNSLKKGLEQEKDIEYLLRVDDDLEKISNIIMEGTYKDHDLMRKDSLDRFLDHVFFMIKTGYYYIINLAYPTKRMLNKQIEEKIIKLINIYLYPEIVYKLLKHFASNIHNSDTNLYLAYLIVSDEIIMSLYNTFLLFKKDIFEPDPDKRCINVKKIQQFSPRSDNKFSSPLDSACRFKYILEYIALKLNVEHLYSISDISLTNNLLEVLNQDNFNEK